MGVEVVHPEELLRSVGSIDGFDRAIRHVAADREELTARELPPALPDFLPLVEGSVEILAEGVEAAPESEAFRHGEGGHDGRRRPARPLQPLYEVGYAAPATACHCA